MELFMEVFMEVFMERYFFYHPVDANDMIKRSRRQQKAAL